MVMMSIGQVNAANFPNVCDYRNLALAESLKVFGYINKFKFVVHTAQKYLADNNNPPAEFDRSPGTAFKVTVFVNNRWKTE
jgi:ATP-dependent DNA helicase RecG